MELTYLLIAFYILLFAFTFIAIALPIKLLFSENIKTRFYATLTLVFYSFAYITLFIIYNIDDQYLSLDFFLPHSVDTVFGYLFNASFAGILALICSVLVMYYYYKKLSIKTSNRIKILFVSAFIFNLALFIFINIFVHLQIRIMAWHQFGNNQCALKISNPYEMLKLRISAKRLDSYALVLAPTGEYNWSFESAKWTPNTYTGASSDDVIALEKKKLKDIESYKLCVSKIK